MKLDTLTDSHQRKCKNYNSVTSDFRVISLPNFCLEHISKSIDYKYLKLDTVIEGYEGKCRMKEP